MTSLIKALDRWQRKLPLSWEGKLWLLFSLALLVTGLFRSINLINLLGCFMLAALLYNLWLAWRQLRPLRGQRISDQIFFAGTAKEITLELTNVRRRTVSGLRLVQQGQDRFVASLPGKQAVYREVSLTFPRRGRRLLRPYQVRCGFPLGLADFQRVLVAEEEIIVLPALGFLRRGVLRRHLQQHSPTVGQARTVPRRHPSAQTDFHGLRQFQPADSPRWIHWRTTARRGELMVKEFEETPSDNLILIVDPYWPVGQASVPGPEQPSTVNRPAPAADDMKEPHAGLELALRLAATICWEWCRQKGDRLVLAIAGQEPVVLGGMTGTDLAVAMLRLLAVQHGGPQSDVPRLMEALAAAELPPAPVLIVSAHDCEFLDELQEQLHRTIALVDVSRHDHEEFYEDEGAIENPRLDASLENGYE